MKNSIKKIEESSNDTWYINENRGNEFCIVLYYVNMIFKFQNL